MTATRKTLTVAGDRVNVVIRQTETGYECSFE